MRLYPFILILASAMLFACSAPRTQNPPSAVLEVAGVLREDTLWQGEVLMLDDVLVPRGRTLTILPGTRIRVQSAGSTKLEPLFLSTATELLVRGEIYVAGTSEQPVRFSPVAEDEGSLEEPVWGGIILDGALSAHFQHLDLEKGEICLQSLDTSMQARHLRLFDCRYGLILQGEGFAELEDLQVEAGEVGLLLWEQAQMNLLGGRFTGQAEEAIHLGSHEVHIQNVLIRGTALGVVADPRKVDLSGLIFEDNGRNIYPRGAGAP